MGIEAQHERLKLVDPLSAAKLHPHDVRRILRALEVYRLTGQPISHQQLQFDEGLPASACKVWMLNRPRPILHERISCRVDRMFQEGLVDEVRRLMNEYGELSRTAAQAVGYREVLQNSLAGEISEPAMVANTKTRTRRFAKRQWTWFRQLGECRWLDVEPQETVSDWPTV